MMFPIKTIEETAALMQELWPGRKIELVNVRDEGERVLVVRIHDVATEDGE